MCLFVMYVSEHIYRNTRYLPIFVPIAMARSSSSGVTQSQGAWVIFGVFFLIDNVLHSITFETHAKTADSIEMPFGLMT